MVTPTAELLALSIEQRARDLLAAEYERDGIGFLPGLIRKPGGMLTMFEDRSIRAIKAALTEASRPSLSAQAVGDGWRSIESAPKDGTRVRLMNANNGLRDVGSYHDWGDMSDLERETLPDHAKDWTGEWSQDDGNGEMTHWQPRDGATPPQPADGGDRVGELVEAAHKYAFHYARDEASIDGDEITGCSKQQHLDAVALFAALAKFQPAGGES